MVRHRHKHHSSNKRISKNIVNKTIEKSVSIAKSTSKKYIPKLKFVLENVGSRVVKTGEKYIPFLQSITRKFLRMFSTKSLTRKNRSH